MTPMAIFLVPPMPLAKLAISSPPLSAASKVMTSTSSLIEEGQRLGIEPPLGFRTLGGGVAPAGVAPHLRLLPQALHLPVEGLDQEVAGDLLVVHTDHAVDRRLLDLDDGAARIGQLDELLVHGGGERHDQIAAVLEMHVMHAGRDHLPRDRAELDGLAGLALRHLPHPRILQRPAPHRPGHVRQHARLEHLEHDVAGCLVAAGRGAPAAHVVSLEPLQALGGVGEPRSPADVAIAARIAVGQQIEPGTRLVGEVGGNGIRVLLAEGDIRHGHRERPAPQVLHEPVRTRQRAGDGGQQRVVLRDGQHRVLHAGSGEPPYGRCLLLPPGDSNQAAAAHSVE